MMTSKEFKKYVYFWSDKLGLNGKIKEIHIRKMKTKIASCSNNGRLTFDKNILNEDIKKIDEIIVHELLHLKYPNHSKMFKAMFNYYIKNKS